jgi:hypothetical protein
MRSLIIAANAALAFASAAYAATPAPGPYTLDSHGNCHAANYTHVERSLCPTPSGPYRLGADGFCHASGGQLVAAVFCRR